MLNHYSEGKKNLFNRRNFLKFLCVSSMSLITTIFSFRGGGTCYLIEAQWQSGALGCLYPIRILLKSPFACNLFYVFNHHVISRGGISSSLHCCKRKEPLLTATQCLEHYWITAQFFWDSMAKKSYAPLLKIEKACYRIERRLK